MVDKVLEYLITAKNQANQVFDNVQKSISGLNDEAGKTKERFQSFTEGFADLKAGFDMVTEVASKVAEVINEVTQTTLNYAEEVRSLSRTIGATAEETSMLIQAADDTKVSYESLTIALETAIRKGVEPSITGIGKLADQYNSIQNPIERTKFLMDTFGRAGADLAPLMQQGAAGIRELGQAAADAGLVLDEKAVQAARNYEMALDNLTDRIDAQKIKWGNEWIPVATNVMDINVRMAETVEENNLQWMNIIPVLGGVRDVFLLISESIQKSSEDANKAADDIASAQSKLSSFQSYAGNVPVMGHGTAYKAGQGPAYPYSESNPTGYVYDPYTGAYDYPGRASGGPVFAGIPRVVGEKRAEVFTPEQSGFISPDASAVGGGAGNITIQVTNQSMFSLADEAQARQVLYPIIFEAVMALKQNGKI